MWVLGTVKPSLYSSFTLNARSRFAVARPVVLISNRYYIRNITLDGRNETLIVNNLTNAVALDFDWLERKIYWSDTTSTQSRIMRMGDDGGEPWDVSGC